MSVIRKQWLAAVLSLTIVSGISRGQAVPPEKADEARIDRLLHQLTLEEKMDLIRGGVEDAAVYQGQAGFLPGVPRLHIPSLRFADGPPGLLTRVPAQAETATMGVAATFSTKDAEANGAVIGREGARSESTSSCSPLLILIVISPSLAVTTHSVKIPCSRGPWERQRFAEHSRKV